MLDLKFEITGAGPERVAAAPLMVFKVRVTEAAAPDTPATPIHAIALRSQLQIEPARRRYTPQEQARLLDLFGTPERWGQTVRPMLWTHASTVVRPFTGVTEVDLPVPCTSDFCLAATKYFDALESGEIPLCFLFSGTIFYEGDSGALQVAQVPWNNEAYYRLPAKSWKDLMEIYYPNVACLTLRKDVFDLLNRYRTQRGLPTWEHALEALLADEKEPAVP
jgi:Family of unknown function (DUF6084)